MSQRKSLPQKQHRHTKIIRHYISNFNVSNTLFGHTSYKCNR